MRRWTATVLAVLLVLGGPGAAAAQQAQGQVEYEVNKVAPLTWRYRITGKTYEVTASVETSTTTRTQQHQVMQTRRGVFLTEGLGDRPISLNEAAAVLLRQAQASGSPVSTAGVQGQVWSIWNSTVAKARFISGAIADVWRAYNTYDDGRFMTIEDRYEAWKAMGFYEKYNETQIKFINQRVIPIVRMAKAAQGVLGAVMVGLGYASLAAGALTMLGITAPAWAVAGGLAAVVGGIAAVNVAANIRRHRAGQDMLASSGAFAATAAPGTGVFGGSFWIRPKNPFVGNNQFWRLTWAREDVAWWRELARQGRYDHAAIMRGRALANLGRFGGGLLAGLLGEWLLGDATRDILRAENLGTIPLPGQVVEARRVVRTQPNVHTNVDVNERAVAIRSWGTIKLRVHLVPSQ